MPPVGPKIHGTRHFQHLICYTKVKMAKVTQNNTDMYTKESSQQAFKYETTIFMQDWRGTEAMIAMKKYYRPNMRAR